MKKYLLMCLSMLVEIQCFALYQGSREFVELPEGAKPQLYKAEMLADWNPVSSSATTTCQCVEVAIVDSQLFVKGIFSPVAPEAWIKGDIEGDVVTFPNGQYVGNVELPYRGKQDVWLMDFFVPMQWKFDREAGCFDCCTGSANLMIDDGYSLVCMVSGLHLADCSKLTGKSCELVCPPVSETAEYYDVEIEAHGREIDSLPFDVSREGQMCIDNDNIYVKCICAATRSADSWVKGYKIDETRVGFPPNQFLGIRDNSMLFWFGNLENSDVIFRWDNDGKTLVLDSDSESGASYTLINDQNLYDLYEACTIRVTSSADQPDSILEFKVNKKSETYYDLFGRQGDASSSHGFIVNGYGKAFVR